MQATDLIRRYETVAGSAPSLPLRRFYNALVGGGTGLRGTKAVRPRSRHRVRVYHDRKADIRERKARQARQERQARQRQSASGSSF